MSRSFQRFKSASSVFGFLIVCITMVVSNLSLFAQNNQPEDVIQKAIAQFEHSQLQSSSLGDGIYLFSGDGGNVVAIADSGSTLLIDSGIESQATALNKAVFEITHRPITRLINTHWHFDHTGGNTFFGSSGVTIIAQKNVKARLASTQNVPFINLHDGPYPDAALPSLTYVDHLELEQGLERLHLAHFDTAHTDDDTVVFLQPANIVVMGDIFSEPFYPIIDLTSGGSLQGIIDSIDQVLAASNEQTRYVPGHGPLATQADLRAYRNMLATIQERITTMVREGKTIDQVVAAQPSQDFDAKWGTGYVDGKVFTEMAYTSIANH